MPVYEYRCDSCSQILEVIQKFSDTPLVDCERCGGKDVLKKQVSLSSFALKGSGWYSTDYKKKSGESGGASPSSSAAPESTTATPTVKPSDKKVD